MLSLNTDQSIKGLYIELCQDLQPSYFFGTMSRDLQSIVDKINSYGWKKFLNDHSKYLRENTSPVDFARELRSANVIIKRQYDTCFANPSEEDQNYALYDLVAKKDKYLETLRALEGANDHILDYIQKELQGAPAQPERNESQPPMNSRQAHLEDVISRVEERLENMPSHFDLPLKEFFRPNLSKLYVITGDGILQLIQRLQETGELHDDTVEELEAMTTNRKRCEKVYQIVAQRKALRQLIFALEETNNSHVIDLMESWL